MKFVIPAVLFMLVALTGCGTPFQGIKLRAQAPTIEDAFRKISLAITADGYETEMITSSPYALTTTWREPNPQEAGKARTPAGVLRTEYRLALQMEPRGRLYDVFLTPSLRFSMQDGRAREEVAPAGHTLSEKWEGVLKQLLVKEMKEED